MIADYEACVKHINDIPLFSHEKNQRNKSGNDNLTLLMDELGNPHKKIKSIHIAGTNGKGSTANFIKCILNEMGYTTGLFTSPHLVDIRERIAVDDIISKEDFVYSFNKVSDAEKKIVENGGMHISYFEYLFAMAAVYFDLKKTDYVIYETGLGGRLDATNLLSPQVTVITSIGLDHMKYLGDSIELIAAEKAGIIKKDTPVIYNTGSREADEVISKVAKRHNAKEINVAKTEYIINDVCDKTIDFSAYNSYYRYDNLVIRSSALYQVDNALSAIAACNELFKNDGTISCKIIRQAMKRFFWSGRMEKIYPNVIIDGAHNDDAIERFVETVNGVYGDKAIEILFAVCEDKDYKPMIKLICDELSLKRVYVTPLETKRTADVSVIAELFRNNLKNNKKDAEIIEGDSIEKTFRTAMLHVLNRDDTMLFCVGSLYLAGSIKEIAMEAKDD
ncbi:MAG: bifunctional folylpolyglutamate synthase/dihydrofolate synthase [Lachnospiraceae bacterium]|nr:bifunctional folylpolyglutamate synthase/dihydrofolate synthase [Lachnospiraceae bacterium]MBQ9233936.1 bifunctional folylpolyglutamate synthase/dihydrofolate synthase [Lachnospiraceae bacterium]